MQQVLVALVRSRGRARRRSTPARSGAAARTARSCAALEQARVRAHGVHVRDDGVGLDRCGRRRAGCRAPRRRDSRMRSTAAPVGSRRRARVRASSRRGQRRACRRADTRRRPRSACARCRTARRATRTGDEPTYCVKWSSICATRSSGDRAADRAGDALAHAQRRRSRERRRLERRAQSNVSRRPPTVFQKKNCSEIRCSRFAMSMKRA